MSTAEVRRRLNRLDGMGETAVASTVLYAIACGLVKRPLQPCETAIAAWVGEIAWRN
jgi:hypothetical protein